MNFSKLRCVLFLGNLVLENGALRELLVTHNTETVLINCLRGFYLNKRLFIGFNVFCTFWHQELVTGEMKDFFFKFLDEQL